MSELIVGLVFGFVAGCVVTFRLATEAVDSAFDEWERNNPGVGWPTGKRL